MRKYLEKGEVEMVVVSLVRNKLGTFSLEIIDFEQKEFSDKHEAEQWLTDNNFVYGQRDFFKYKNSDDKQWCHINDVSWEFIDVTIETKQETNGESRYKNFIPDISPWAKAAYYDGLREGFAETIVKLDIPRDEKIKRFAEHFGDSIETAKYWISFCEKNSNV